MDSDEVAHYEPPHPDLHCFQIQLFSFFGALSINLSLNSAILTQAVIPPY